jgi:hypothetical protein
MKTMLLAAAALFIAAPAFAQSYDPEVGSGNIAPAQAAPVYQGAHGAYQGAQGAQGAYARVPTGTRVPGARIPGASPAPNAVYDEHNNVIGADPDPNVRLQLQRDHDSIQ